MEHIVQFAVSVDDEYIKARIAENAEREVKKELKAEIREKIFAKYGYDRDKYGYATAFTEELFQNWLEENKEAVIRETAEIMAEKTMKSKTWRGAVRNAAMEKIGEEENA